MNDIAFDGVSSDLVLSYATKFAKIYKGEQFKSVLTLMNLSKHFSLERMKIRVQLKCLKNQKSEKRSTVIFENKTKDWSLHAKQSVALPLTFAVEFEDTYYLVIDVCYVSKYFSEQLSQ